MLENFWCYFTLYGTPVRQDQEQVQCLQTPNCFNSFNSDSFKLGHRDKARNPVRMCKIQDRQMSERQSELRAKKRLANSHPTPPQALPRGAILHKTMQAGAQKSIRKQTSLKSCRSSLFTFGFDTHSWELFWFKAKVFSVLLNHAHKKDYQWPTWTFFCGVSVLLTTHLSVLKITFFTMFAS